MGGNSQGYDPGTMDSMYAVLVKMIPTIDPPAYQFSKNFDRERFFYLFWQFALVDVVVSVLSCYFRVAFVYRRDLCTDGLEKVSRCCGC